MLSTEALRSLVFDSVEQHIAVIDDTGKIIDVNQAWTNFGMKNGAPAAVQWHGTQYLKHLQAAAAAGDSHAAEALAGIMDVIKGERGSFYLEYPCHSPSEKRWFMMQVIRLSDLHENLYVITHQNITQRKLAEERAQQLATQDPLTGLANRRHLDDVLKTEIRRSARAQTPLSLIVLDVDHFKDYNDAHGHLMGDECLKRVGTILGSACRRPTDLAARLGGDEFILLLVDTDIHGSLKIAQEVVNSVRGLGMIYGKTGNITVSVGVASALPNLKTNSDILIHEADKALYRAKAAGRDRVEHTLLGDPDVSITAHN